MVLVPIHQDTSSVPPMTTLVSKAVDEIVTDAVGWEMQVPLRAYFSDLPTIDIKKILQQRMFEDKSYKAHEDHKKLYDVLEKSLERDYSNQLLSDLEEASLKKRKRRDLPRTPSGSPPLRPLPPPPPAGASGAPGTSGALGSSQLPLPPLPSSTDSLIQYDYILDEQVHFSDDEDFGNDYYQKLIREKTSGNHYLKRKDQRLLNLLGPFLLPILRYDKFPELVLPASKQDQACTSRSLRVDWTNPEGDQVRVDVNRPLPLGGPPDMILRRVENKSDHTFEFSVSSELKPTQDTGHLDHLSGCDKLMLSTAVKLWTRKLVIRQWVEDFQLVIESYQTQLNLTKPGWDAIGYEFKHDYTIIESPRAAVFPVNNNEQRIMWFNKIDKFSDGTLIQILEALAYRVKEFKIKRLNLGTPSSMCQTISNIDAHVEGEKFHELKQSRTTYNTASASLMLAIMIQKSVSMLVRSIGLGIKYPRVIPYHGPRPVLLVLYKPLPTLGRGG
nr:hypothetical protein [Tanacetum cinerariifolium]